MAGIAGITSKGKRESVEKMLNKISHRGKAGKEIVERNGTTIGIIWNNSEQSMVQNFLRQQIFCDSGDHIRKAEAKISGDKLFLARDELGVAPLYYGSNTGGELCFASEVKALSPIVTNINELLPGHSLIGKSLIKNFQLQRMPSLGDNADKIASELKKKLNDSITACITSNETGSWLSGGLDSSAISALARKHVKKLQTFAAGVRGAPDLEYAKEVASYIDTDHHEIIVSLEDMITSLPRVIYHLESFDALLVRSSIINFLAGKEASNYISNVFSGEVGDELFAGYSYLKSIPEDQLEDELIDITSRLHNTALQRVDRCSSAHEITAHVPFADPEVFKYALTIPVKYKLYDGVEKWIVRKALEGELPERVLNRPKAKFWEGGGVGEMLADYADNHISDNDFRNEKNLANGWTLISKEELMYYRIFKEIFFDLENLNWMGRTK
jgi:asparagine synthase (glutamine-hydrolysing)